MGTGTKNATVKQGLSASSKTRILEITPEGYGVIKQATATATFLTSFRPFLTKMGQEIQSIPKNEAK